MRQEELRPLIVHLVRAIAEIPQQDRAVWWKELCEKNERNALAGEECMVFMVLNNLPVGESLAGRPEPKVTQKVVSLRVIRGGRGSRRGPGVKKSSRAGRGGKGPARRP